MKENKYDDPDFFEQYGRMPRSVHGLHAAGEWQILKGLLPDLKGKSMLDLGCGYGWHCIYAKQQGAAMVTGIDLSEKMIVKAKEQSGVMHIDYRQIAIEDYDYQPAVFDLVLSSLALHYVADLNSICRKIYACLKPGGQFVFSTEHPIFTAMPQQDWITDAAGNRLHWPVDRYQEEGLRRTHFLGHEVVKYHRTVAGIFKSLLDAGFMIKTVSEPRPSEDIIIAYPEMKDESRRPVFLLIAAEKSNSDL